MGKYRFNRYRDVELDISFFPFANKEEFDELIRAETAKWFNKLKYPRVEDMAVMWMSVPKDFSHVVPWLLEMKPPFVLHHANASRIMLVRQANPHSRHRGQIPAYGTHYVKVECVVVEEGTNRVLMVRERLGGESVMKLVTGSTDAGEFISDSAEREVWEETRIKCRAVNLIGCANRVRTRFDRDEAVFGLLLFAPQGQVPRADGFEVREAGWFDMSVALEHCTAMSREWLNAAAACKGVNMQKTRVTDLFRGHPFFMDFFTMRQSLPMNK